MGNGGVFPGRIIFDHLPKTGGQAINAWLRMMLGTGCVTTNLIGKHHELIRQYGGMFSIISAHIDFSGDELDPRYCYATCVREPVDRALSFLYFVISNHRESQLPHAWAAAKEFIRTEGVWSDVELFIESQGDTLRPGIGFNAIGRHVVNPVVEHFAAIDGPTFSIGGDEKLGRALSAIERYDVFGLYEQLPDFLSDFSALLGIPAPSGIDRVNVTRERPLVEGVSDKFRTRLEELNALDLEFYRVLRTRYHGERSKWHRDSVANSQWRCFDRPGPRRFGMDKFCLIRITLDGEGTCRSGSLLMVTVEFSLGMSLEDPEFGIHLIDDFGRKAFGTNTTQVDQMLPRLDAGTHRFCFSLVANLPEGGYEFGVYLAQRESNGVREIAALDGLLRLSVTVERTSRTSGYVDLATSWYRLQISDRVVQSVCDGAGSMQCLRNISTGLTVGEVFQLPIYLTNSSGKDWVGQWSHPINVSYRWMDESSNVVVSDGLRTPLPNGELAVNSTVEMALSVRAPDRPGRYQLCALPVQEGNCWFDTCGFAPMLLVYDVISICQERYFSASDPRLYSSVGMTDRSEFLSSSGVPGCLLYGPYTRLGVGRWIAVLNGSFNPNGGVIRADVVSAKGTLSIAEKILTEPRNSIHFDITLASEVDDLEVRVFVDSLSQVQLVSLLLEQTSLADEPSQSAVDVIAPNDAQDIFEVNYVDSNPAEILSLPIEAGVSSVINTHDVAEPEPIGTKPSANSSTKRTRKRKK